MSDDLARRLANLIRFGTVESVTAQPPRVRVKLGGLLTTSRPWVSMGCGTKVNRWASPSIGEQVIFFSPNGETSAGVALCGIPSSLMPPPDRATTDNVIVAFGDGAVFVYDTIAHGLTATLPAGGRIEVVAPGGFLFRGDARFEGSVEVEKDLGIGGNANVAGTVKGDVDVIAAGVSGKGHTHGGVQSGGADTSPPT